VAKDGFEKTASLSGAMRAKQFIYDSSFTQP